MSSEHLFADLAGADPRAQEEESLGRVFAVSSTRVTVEADEADALRRARVGRLVWVKGHGGGQILVGVVERVWRRRVPAAAVARAEPEEEQDRLEPYDDDLEEAAENGFTFLLVGTYRERVGDERQVFTRSLGSLPDIDEHVFALEETRLERFMAVLSRRAQEQHSEPLEVGRYALDDNAKAFLDGNRLFQRHATLVGSTGAGKSWAVATLLERASALPHANILLFDVHGEYRSLSYAQHLRVAGPTDLGRAEEGVLYLPYWLLDFDELQAMVVDQTEFTAHNQVGQLQVAVERERRTTLEDEQRTDVLQSFTVDSPVPYSLDAVVDHLETLNTEMVQGARGLRQGPYHGQFNRLLHRLDRRRKDRRYGFLYEVPPTWMRYEAMHDLAELLLGHGADGGQSGCGVKVIDFAEVPADVLPVMVGLVARLVLQIQLWTDPGPEGDARHPVLLVCDEAHLYLPKRREGGEFNPRLRRSVRSFDRIAKEGRKYGVGLLVVTQRPADVSETVLAQCGNFLCLRLTNHGDQAVVSRLLPESMKGLLEVLPVLDTGEAVVVGDAILLPTRVRLSPPRDKPLSRTIDFWDRWGADEAPGDLTAAVEAMRRQGRGRAT